MSNDQLVDRLNDLIRINIDAHEGFVQAAGSAQNNELKEALEFYANERQRFVHYLKTQVQLLDGTTSDSGSWEATAHRTWMDIKAELFTDRDKAIIEECIRGEKLALKNYENMLDAITIPAALRAMLIKQHNAINDTLQQIEEWRKKYELDA